MLTLALAATLVGFVLLVLGLITGTVWLAIACIVVCLLGLGFLIADIVGGRRNSDDRSLSDYVGSDRSSPADDVDADTDEPRSSDPAPAWESHGRESPTRDFPARDFPGREQELSGREAPAHDPVPPQPYVDGTADTGRIPVVSDVPAPMSRRPDTRGTPDTYSSAIRPQRSPSQSGAGNNRDQSLDDYLRSIGATPPPPTPRSSPVGPSPLVSAPPENAADTETSAIRRSARSAGSTSGVSRTDTADGSGQSTPPKAKFDPLDPNWHPPLDD